MKTKKMPNKINFIILLIITSLHLLSCKKLSENNEKLISNDTIQQQKIDSTTLLNNNNVDLKNNQQKTSSFVISCGSGCALTYSEESRILNNLNYELKFRVTNYIDEKIIDENIKIYIFEFNLAGTIKSIHLKGSNENILLNEDILIRIDLIKIANTLNPNKVKKYGIAKNSLVVEDEPYKMLTLPFNSKIFVQNKSNLENEKYQPSSFLIEYLIKIGYEGEEYSCYFLKSDIEFTNMIVSISRADSLYFLLLKSNQNNVLSYDEIGSNGGKDTIYFKINKNLVISTYSLNNIELKKIKI